jgi:hypothetical protein
MRLKLAVIIAAVIALPISVQAGNHKAANGHHKVNTMQGKIKGQTTVDQPNVYTPGDSYSLTR